MGTEHQFFFKAEYLDVAVQRQMLVVLVLLSMVILKQDGVDLFIIESVITVCVVSTLQNSSTLLSSLHWKTHKLASVMNM
jgi:hypothetical protein